MEIMIQYKGVMTDREIRSYKKYSSFALSNLFRMLSDETNKSTTIEIPYNSIRDAVLGVGSEEYLEEIGESLFYHKVIIPAIEEINSVGVLKISDRAE